MHQKQKNHWALVAQFGGHVLMGAVLFILLAVPAVALSLLVHVVAAWGVDGFTITLLHWLAHAILIGDAILLVTFLVIGIINFVKEL